MPRVPKAYLDARRDEILDAAHACFQEKGFHQATIQDICRQAELSPGAVYRYFKSKDDIIAAGCDRSTKAAGELVGQALSAGSGAGGALEALARYFFSEFFGNPAFEASARFNTEFHAEVLRNPVLRKAGDEQFEALHRLVTGLLRERMQQLPHLAGATPEALANVLEAAYLGLEFLMLIRPDDVDLDGVLQVVRSILGLAEHPAA